jgi:hypothetical protein
MENGEVFGKKLKIPPFSINFHNFTKVRYLQATFYGDETVLQNINSFGNSSYCRAEGIFLDILKSKYFIKDFLIQIFSKFSTKENQ